MKEFYVLVWDINKNVIKHYDILPYFRRMYDECPSEEQPTTFEEWRTFVISWGKYNYWARCEYEFIVSPWPSQDKEVKIDVWYQIEKNIDLLAEILMEEKNSQRQTD